MTQSPLITPELQRKIAATQAEQAKADAVGMEAATSATPGPLRAAFSSRPDIEVGTFKVRRFADRDFIFLSELGHPLQSFSAVANDAYDFAPSGKLAWQICWLLTRPIQEVKEKMKQGVPFVNEEAADIIGAESPVEISALLSAVKKQMMIYAGAHLEIEQVMEDEQSRPPLSLEPSQTASDGLRIK